MKPVFFAAKAERHETGQTMITFIACPPGLPTRIQFGLEPDLTMLLIQQLREAARSGVARQQWWCAPHISPGFGLDVLMRVIDALALADEIASVSAFPMIETLMPQDTRQ